MTGGQQEAGHWSRNFPLPCGRVGPCQEADWDEMFCACRVPEQGLAIPYPKRKEGQERGRWEVRREGRKAVGRKDLRMGWKQEQLPEMEEGKKESRREGRKKKRQKSRKEQKLKGSLEMKVAGGQEKRLKE